MSMKFNTERLFAVSDDPYDRPVAAGERGKVSLLGMMWR